MYTNTFYIQRSDQQRYSSFMLLWWRILQSSAKYGAYKLLKPFTNLICKGYWISIIVDCEAGLLRQNLYAGTTIGVN